MPKRQTFYKRFISSFLDRKDSETWHIYTRDLLHVLEKYPLTLKLLEMVAFGGRRIIDKQLHITVDGILFENPALVGAGWDKEGKSVKGLYALGFAGVEIPALLYPQPGNPKPRQFVIGPGVVLQSLGFNTPGAYVIKKNLSRYRKSGIPIGIGLAKNKNIPDIKAPKAYAEVAKVLYKDAAYFVINVSSPNTPGLKKLQGKKPLTRIVHAVLKAMEQKGGRKPLFVKVSPELNHTEMDDVIDVVLKNRLTGIVAVNTWDNPKVKAKYGEQWRNQPGGVSGDDAAYRKLATEQVKYIYKKTKGKIIIIGVGAIKDAPTALQRIKAGASLIQVVAGIRGEGPSVAANINRGILAHMKKNKIQSLQELVGSDVIKKNEF